MNRHTILGLFLALSSVSCQLETEDPETSSLAGIRYVDAVITAYQEGDDGTRTVLTGANLTTVNWCPGDAISVFSAGENVRFTTAISSNSATATFTGSVPVDMGKDGVDDDIWALYPYSSSASYSDDSILATLPSTQTGKSNSFDDNLMLMVGKISNPLSAGTAVNTSGYSGLTAHFYHVCAAIRFQVNRNDIETVTVTSNGQQPLAGTVRIGLDGNGKPEVLSVVHASPSVTLTAPDGVFQTGVWYYIVTLPANLSQGITISVATGNKEGSRRIQTGFNLNRHEFKSDSALDDGIVLTSRKDVQVALPDTWVAVDELNRALPSNAPNKRKDREVLMFYWPWHETTQVDYAEIVNIPQVLSQYGNAALQDSLHVGWKGYNHICFWGQPLYGYYRTTDPWVLRKHAELLADAGVDAVFFDLTNGTYTWWNSVEKLMEVWTQAQEDGVNVPKIAFMSNLIPCVESAIVMRALYRALYGVGRYKNLWYYVDGKPCIMAFPASFSSVAADPIDSEIKNFFTFRPGQFDYVSPDQGDSYGNPMWGWLQVNPQHVFGDNDQIPVSVAQNASNDSGGHAYAFNAPGSYGRSYTHANGNGQLNATSYRYGYNFQEQWDYARAHDPKRIFVTGWNEWIAMEFGYWPNRSHGFGPVSFPDQYDWERSRDIEPNAEWGDYGDVYYYQLIQNIRMYKGVVRYPNVTEPVTMAIDGDFTGWDAVSPDFKHYPGNTMHRSHWGHTNGSLYYTNNTGRNDIVDARVTRDANYLYFYVETQSDLTPYTDQKWMRLFINIDCNWSTGWKGYDYCLNYRNPANSSQGYVSRCSGSSWNWSDAGTFDYRMVGNKMEIRVARTTLGLTSASRLDFAFKWSDNMQSDGQILDFYVNGDAAPGGRFNFHYKEPND